jgi:adenylate cyclase
VNKCRKCGFENPDNMKFCGDCGAKLDQGSFGRQAERRTVVILFADIAGYTSLSEKLDPEQVREILNKCFAQVAAIVKKYGGTIDKYVGDEVMALFGVPLAHENDAERALRSALEINQAMKILSRELGLGLSMRQGLNIGEVVTGSVGGDRQSAHTVIGDAVNVASRLEHLAEPGQIMVSNQLYLLVRHIFEFTGLDPQQVKGKEISLQFHRLEGLSPERGKVRGIEGLWSPMVGREKEMAALLAGLQSSAAESRPQAIFVLADPGLGKSRLLQEYLDRLSAIPESNDIGGSALGGGAGEGRSGLGLEQGHLRLFGRCLPFGGAGLGPILEMVRGLLGIAENDPETGVRRKIFLGVEKYLKQKEFGLLPPTLVLELLLLDSRDKVLGQGLTADQMQKQVKLVLTELIGSLARQKPVLMIVEDLHWADELTLDLIEHLLTFHLDRPLFFLGLSRPIAQEGGQAAALIKNMEAKGLGRTIKLAELKPDEVKKIINSMLEIEELPAAVKNQIVEYSGGNPLFVEEIIRYLIDRKLLLPETGYWRAVSQINEVKIPHTLQGLLLSRIDQLPEAQKSIIQHAAVVGKIFWENLVAELMDVEISTGLADLAVRDMVRKNLQSSLVDDIEYFFKHLLIQEAAYHTMLKTLRLDLHHKVVNLIEERYGGNLETYADLLAYHADKAEDTGRTVKYSILAGDKNRKLYANHQARHFYLRALELLGDRPGTQQQRLETGLKLAEVCSSMGHGDEAIKTLQDCLELTQEPLQQARILRITGGNFQRQSRYDQALQQLEQAGLKLGQEPDQLERVSILQETAWVYYLKGRIDQAKEIVAQLAALLEKLEGLPPEKMERARSALYNLQAIMEAREGNYQPAIGHHLQQIEIHKKRDEIASLGAPYNNLGTVYWSQGNVGQALKYLEKSMEIAEKTGELLSVAISCNNLGGIYLDLNDCPKAKKYFDRYLDINARIANRLGDAFGHAGLGRYYKSQGDLPKALEEFQVSLEVAREVQSRSLESSALFNLSDAHCRLGNLDKARDLYRQAREAMMPAGAKESEGNPLLESRILLAQAERAEGANRTECLQKAKQILLGQLQGGGFSDDDDKPFEAFHLLSVAEMLLGENDPAGQHSQKAVELVSQFCGQLDEEMQARYKAKGEICEILDLGKKLGA